MRSQGSGVSTINNFQVNKLLINKIMKIYGTGKDRKDFIKSLRISEQWKPYGYKLISTIKLQKNRYIAILDN